MNRIASIYASILLLLLSTPCYAGSSGGSSGGSGTVESVALTMPAEFSVAGSPITTTGTLAVTEATQAANACYAGPVSGAAAAPSFRALVDADIPVALTLDDVDTSTGNALTVNATAPTATTGASQAGVDISLTASNAVASTDTEGAAAGGDLNFTAGNAARLTSGNANGGDLNLTPGAGIGTGTAGQVAISTGAAAVGTAAKPALRFGTGDSGIYVDSNGDFYFVKGSSNQTYINVNGGYFKARSDGGYYFASTSDASSTLDAGVRRAAAGEIILVDSGAVSGGKLRTLRVVAAEVTSPETIAVTDSFKVITNEGAGGAVTYNLPTAVAGYEYIFVVQAAQNMVITAAAGDTIRDGSTVTGAAGTATISAIGDVVHLVAPNADGWVVMSGRGTAPSLSAP